MEIPAQIKSHYKHLETESEYNSPMHDAIMSNIAECIKEYGDDEIFSKLWTSSLFPERLTACILTLIDEQKLLDTPR